MEGGHGGAGGGGGGSGGGRRKLETEGLLGMIYSVFEYFPL